MTEQHAERPHREHVVLEIGDGIGALVVYTDPSLHGSEIEISPAGHDGRRAHKGVLERPIGGQSIYAAVFDRLEEGSYTLWSGGHARARDVSICGAAVTELDWRQRPLPSSLAELR